MGANSFGIPEKPATFLRKELGLNVFIEGGTYKGGTAKRMSAVFSHVVTIENSRAMYEKAVDILHPVENVDLLYGDTREHLKGLLPKYDDILFWLDAHWSGGHTYGEGDECPLIEELKIIFDYVGTKSFCILIDDARLFLAPPMKPHKVAEWPTIVDIVDVMPDDWNMRCYDDVMYLVPGTVTGAFDEFLQDVITTAACKRAEAGGRVAPIKELWGALSKFLNTK